MVRTERHLRIFDKGPRMYNEAQRRKMTRRRLISITNTKTSKCHRPMY